MEHRQAGNVGAAFALLFVPLLLFAVPPAARAETLRLSGTGGAMGGLALLSSAFERGHPGVKVVLAPNMGSSGSIKAALSGKLDVAVSGRALNDDERDRGGREVPYVRTAFVFAVHPDVPVEDITLSAVRKIYAGDTTSWPDGTPARVILRPASDSDTEVLKGMPEGLASAADKAYRRKGMVVATTDQDAVDYIQSTPGAIGTTTLALVLSEKRRVRILSLAGVTPSNRAVKEGAYPYVKVYRFVTGAHPPGAAKAFIAFARSPAGASILSGVGCVVTR